MESYSFNKRDAEKIVEIIDGGSFTREPRISDPWPDDGPHAAIVYLTTSVSARSGTTLGSGTGRLQIVTSGVLSNYLEADGATTYSFTVYNTTTNTLTANQYAQVKREYATGTWLVDVASCS